MPTSLSPRFPLQLAVRRRARNRALPPPARSASIAAILPTGVSSIRKIPAISVRSNHPTGWSGRPAGRLRSTGLCSSTGRSDSALGRTGRSGRTTRPAGPVEPLDRPAEAGRSGQPIRSAASTGRSVTTGRSTGPESAATDRLASLESEDAERERPCSLTGVRERRRLRNWSDPRVREPAPRREPLPPSWDRGPREVFRRESPSSPAREDSDSADGLPPTTIPRSNRPRGGKSLPLFRDRKAGGGPWRTSLVLQGSALTRRVSAACPPRLTAKTQGASLNGESNLLCRQ